jgi:hypothetical protein
MKPTHFLLLAAIFGWLAIQAGPAPAQDDKAMEEEAAKLGVEAAAYGFPLVIVNVTKRVQTNVEEPNHLGHAPVNQFSNFLKYPTAAYKDVVRMNVDTLYSFAWLARWRQGTEIADQHRHDRRPDPGERHRGLRSGECDPEAIQTDSA